MCTLFIDEYNTNASSQMHLFTCSCIMYIVLRSRRTQKISWELREKFIIDHYDCVTHNKITTCTLTRTAFATPFDIEGTNYKKFSEEFSTLKFTLQKYICSEGIIHEGLSYGPLSVARTRVIRDIRSTRG